MTYEDFIRSQVPAKSIKKVKIPNTRDLYLIIRPSGRKTINFLFKRGKMEKFIKLGEPEWLSVEDAQTQAFLLMKKLALGEFISKNENITFYEITQLAMDHHVRVKNIKQVTMKAVNHRLNYIFSRIGRKRLLDVTVNDIKDIYNSIEEDGKIATLKRVNQYFGIVYSYAIKYGYIEESQNILPKVGYETNYQKYTSKIAKHHEKLLNEDEISNFLSKLISQEDNNLNSIVASIFILQTGMRIGSIKNLKWKFFNENMSLLIYPKELLKGEASTLSKREDLILPLSKTLSGILLKFKNTINPNARTSNDLVFCNRLGKVLNETSINSLLKSCGGITAHGLRGSLITAFKKKFKEHRIPWLYIRMYCHQKPTNDEIAEAYTEISYKDKEVQETLKEIAEWWDQYLLNLVDFKTNLLERLY